MDTPTQALLGAVVGQACFSHKLGKRALWWGALGGAIPDFDLLPIAFLGPWGEFLYHRGPTHALWFGPVAGSLFGYAVWRLYARKGRKEAGADPRNVGSGATEQRIPQPGDRDALSAWIGLFVLAFLSQPFLDVFTTYGTQLFAPFSTKRFALDAVPIIDPLYSLILIAALAIWVGTPPGRRIWAGRRAALIALVLSTAYLFYGLWLNERAGREVRRQLSAAGSPQAQVRVYPTIFQVFLRRVVARVDNEVLVGSITMWKRGPVWWHRFEIPEHPLIQELLGTPEGRIFLWFADGEISPRVIELSDGFLVEIDDLRYGFFQEPDQGIWGIRGIFDRQGKLHGDVVRFDRHPDVRPEMLLNLWLAAFGLIPEIPGSGGLPEGLPEKGVATEQAWVPQGS